MTAPCALYRHYDASGRLLYVGISLSAVERLGRHMSGAGWAAQIARVEVEHHPTRAAAEDAEVEAIERERPAFNRRHSVRGGAARIIADLPEGALEGVGLSARNIRHAKSSGLFSGLWFVCIRDLCEQHGVECPEAAFYWKGVEAAPSTALEAA